jgi:hypothetical protein
MRTEADQQGDTSATSALAFFWAVLRQIFALLAGGGLASAQEQLDKLERDLDAHILLEARKLAQTRRERDNGNDRDDDNRNDPIYRIVHVNGRFKRVLVQPHERRDPAIRRAAILGYAQYSRALRVLRLATQIAGAGRTLDHRALCAFQFQQLIANISRVIARGFSSAPLHAAALAPVPP